MSHPRCLVVKNAAAAILILALAVPASGDEAAGGTGAAERQTAADPSSGGATRQPALFEDQFDSGLGRWEILGDGSAATMDSGDPAHGRVLVLSPRGDAFALIRGSERWQGVRMEGEVFFPTDEDSYLGFVYNFQRKGERTDFGVIYIKGNESYLQANPHRDFNVGRALYGEHRVPLAGSATIHVGRWQRFAVEVIGRICHVYVGDAATPQLTFPWFENERGAIGLQPRSVGDDAWVDNLRVSPLAAFSYEGPPIPGASYEPAALLTEWSVAGPMARTHDDVARFPDARGARWRPFRTDGRGAVITASVVSYHGPDTVAYFRTRVARRGAGRAILEISTVDDLALWVNGRFHWFIPRATAAWFDFFRAPSHAGQKIPLDLHSGDNDLVLRVRGGVYASGGFFARIADGP